MGGKTAFSWERPPQRDALRNGTSAGSFRKHVEFFCWTLSGSLVLRQKLDGGFLVGIPEHRADDLVIATGANSVAEMRFGVFADVAFQLLPVTAVLPDLFAVGANRKKPTELFDPRERGLRLADTLGKPPLKFHHARANIQPGTQFAPVIGLSQEVVGAGLEPLNKIFLVDPGREKNEIARNLMGCLSHLADDVDPVDTRHHIAIFGPPGRRGASLSEEPARRFAANTLTN